MAWYWQSASAMIVGAFLATGCGSNAIQLVPGDLPHDIAQTGKGENIDLLVRSQKPDLNPNIKQVVDLRPDRPASVTTETPTARVIALVNHQTIFEMEVTSASYQQMAEIAQLPEPERSRRGAEIFKTTLDQIVDREVVLMNADETLKKNNPKVLDKLQEIASKEFEKQWLRPIQKKLGLKNDEEFKAFLKSQNLELGMVKRRWERDFMAMEYLRNRVSGYVDQIGHFQVQDYYERHPEEFQAVDSVQWLDLFLSTADPKHPTRESVREAAESIASKIRQGNNFLDFKSLDNGDSSLRGCKGEGERRGDIRPPEAEQRLFSMKDGEVAVVETDRGCRVIKLVKRQYAGPMPFDEKTQKQIRDKLRGETFQREMKRMVAQWRREAIIIYPKDGK